MKHLENIQAVQVKIESLEHNKTELKFLDNSKFEEKMNLKSLLKSHSFCNENEFLRLKTCLQNIFLNRIEDLETELRKFKITENGI
jgi:hypothetical protein